MSEYEGLVTRPRRPSWSSVYVDFAELLSFRGTCARLRVGCVVTSWDHNRVLAIGYNGNYRGGPNVCDSDVPGECGCIHAEANALIKLDYNDPVRKRMYLTHSPCLACSKLVLNSGVEEVTFAVPYRRSEGIDLLTRNSVTVIAT